MCWAKIRENIGNSKILSKLLQLFFRFNRILKHTCGRVSDGIEQNKNKNENKNSNGYAHRILWTMKHVRCVSFEWSEGYAIATLYILIRTQPILIWNLWLLLWYWLWNWTQHFRIRFFFLSLLKKEAFRKKKQYEKEIQCTLRLLAIKCWCSWYV